MARQLEGPIGVLALLVVPAIVLEDRATNPELVTLAVGLNWTIWLAFCVEFLLFFIAEPHPTTLKKYWFNLALIVASPPFFMPQYLQAARSLRVIRVLRLLRLLRLGVVVTVGLRLTRRVLTHRQFHFVGVVAVGVVFLGAFGIYITEADANVAIKSFGDALWWSVVTATTVGYGDVSPHTPEGRLIAVALMLSGIGVIGVFTASVASFFLQRDDSGQADILARLDVMEQKIDLLLKADEARQRDQTVVTRR